MVDCLFNYDKKYPQIEIITAKSLNCATCQIAFFLKKSLTLGG